MTMDEVTFITVAGTDGVEVEHAIIDRGNGEYTSMPKSVYDEQQAQAEHFTPIVTDAD
jgi:predicted aspartyl protease